MKTDAQAELQEPVIHGLEHAIAAKHIQGILVKVNSAAFTNNPISLSFLCDICDIRKSNNCQLTYLPSEGKLAIILIFDRELAEQVLKVTLLSGDGGGPDI